MAKLTGPQFSVTASGKFGKKLIYSNWRGIAYSKELVVPRNPRTMRQRAHRAVVGVMSALWATIPDGQRAQWVEAGRAFDLPGFHTFAKMGMKAFKVGHAPAREPGAAPTTVDAAVTELAVTVEGDVVTVRYVPSATVTSWGTIITASAAVPIEVVSGEIVAAVAGHIEHARFSLPEGTWYVAATPFDADGGIGEILGWNYELIITNYDRGCKA